MSKRELVQQFVDDHYKHFGYYPSEVETSDGGILDWDAYWKLLDQPEGGKV